MKHTRKWLGLTGVVLIALAISIASPRTAAQTTEQNSASATSTTVPRLIKFSGTLLDEQGHPLKGPVGVTFALYAQQSGGAALWMETQNVEPDASGNYTALLVSEHLSVTASGRAACIRRIQGPNAETIPQPRSGFS